MSGQIITGDNIEAMRRMATASVDAIVTDPPYGLEFMGKSWDRLSGQPGYVERGRITEREDAQVPHGRGGGVNSYQAGRTMQDWHEQWAREALRVLKPGGHLLAFGGTRTSHRLVCAIEDAGFEIRDTIAWMYGSGFPKSLNVSAAIDKSLGAEPIVTGPHATNACPGGEWCECSTDGRAFSATKHAPATAPATAWQGWGTALKPAHEPIVVARKPLTGTVAASVLAHGTGALNVDGCRVKTCDDLNGGAYSGEKRTRDEYSSTDSAPGAVPLSRMSRGIGQYVAPAGRWPANVILDEASARALDEQTGELTSNSGSPFVRNADRDERASYGTFDGGEAAGFYGDTGGASRFFYCAKASGAERNAGLSGFEAIERVGQSAWAGLCNVCGSRMMLNGKPTCGHDDFEWVTGKPTKNVHPTVKPVDLMRWLVRLVTPPGGLVLDPFAGSGTTGCACAVEGVRFVGIEREAEYAVIAEARIAWWTEHGAAAIDVARRRAEPGDPAALTLFAA